MCEEKTPESTPETPPEIEESADIETSPEADEVTSDEQEPTPDVESVDATDSEPQEDASEAGADVGEGEAEPSKTAQADVSDEQFDLYKAAVEALLFATDRPMSSRKIADALNDATDGKAGLDGNIVRRLIGALTKEYDDTGRAFQIEEIAGGFQMLTRAEYHQWVRALAADKQQSKLSPAAIETLAIIAYKQPVGRAVIEDIRGVQSGQMVRTLMEKRLVKVVGREDVVGRPLLYGTTKDFLDHFGLKSIKDLPNIRELPRPE